MHVKHPTMWEDCDEAREFARASNHESVRSSALRAMRQPPGSARMVRTSQCALRQASVVVRNLRLSVRTISLFCKRFNNEGGPSGRRQSATLVSDKAQRQSTYRFCGDSNFFGCEVRWREQRIDVAAKNDASRIGNRTLHMPMLVVACIIYAKTRFMRKQTEQRNRPAIGTRFVILRSFRKRFGRKELVHGENHFLVRGGQAHAIVRKRLDRCCAGAARYRQSSKYARQVE
jgi:hypothetical protein